MDTLSNSSNSSLSTTPSVLSYYNEVYNDLKNGDFDEYRMNINILYKFYKQDFGLIQKMLNKGISKTKIKRRIEKTIESYDLEYFFIYYVLTHNFDVLNYDYIDGCNVPMNTLLKHTIIFLYKYEYNQEKYKIILQKLKSYLTIESFEKLQEDLKINHNIEL